MLKTLKIDRMKGIKSYLKFEFVKQGVIRAYHSSLAIVPNHTYNLDGYISGLWETEEDEETGVVPQTVINNL